MILRLFRIAALGLPFGLVALPAADWNLDTRSTWHGNVTNADRAADRLAALQWRTDISATTFRVLPGGHRVKAGWKFGVELWPRFDGLDAFTTGLAVGWSRKFGLGPQAPVLAMRASGEWVQTRETARSGRGGELALEMSQRWGDAWQGFAGVEWKRYDARGLAFNWAGRTYFLGLSRPAGTKWHLAAEFGWRDGDVISYTTPPRPDLVQAGKVLTLLDTFERAGPLLAYYFPAETASGGITLTRTAGPELRLYLRFEYRDTRHNAVRYLNQLSTVGFSREF